MIRYDPNISLFQVQCFPLQAVLRALDNPKVDYFSLDIEGAEFPVLQSLDWSEVDISVISIEVAHAGHIFDGTRLDIHRFLQNHQYVNVTTVGHDDIFMKKSMIKK